MTQRAFSFWAADVEEERLRTVLHDNTGPDTAARRLGEWLLAHGPATTGEIVEWGRQHLCSSVLERLRLNLRRDCGWPIRSRLRPNSHTHVYWVEGVMEEPQP